MPGRQTCRAQMQVSIQTPRLASMADTLTVRDDQRHTEWQQSVSGSTLVVQSSYLRQSCWVAGPSPWALAACTQVFYGKGRNDSE